MPNCVNCQTLDDQGKEVPCDELIFRPSVYGIIINDGKVLLMNMKTNGKYCFPGGGIETGEHNSQALKREMLEETGLDIEVEDMICFRENFFYDRYSEAGWHTLLFFYKCKTITNNLLADDQVNDDEAIKPRWIDIDTLKEEDLQPMGGNVLELIKKANV